MSTAIICIILFLIICMGIRSFIKRAVSGCCGSGGDMKKVKVDKEVSHYTYKYIVNIDGMHCNHCKQSVENELNSLGGTYAIADLSQNNAVLYAKEHCSELQIRNAVASCGFTVKEIKLCDEK